ncbi:MAG: DUF3883 domain-containing protein [Bacteroidetes bacterium]|nr:DUF3883 domain-containing protein [Bacteroidota bacterium]
MPRYFTHYWATETCNVFYEEGRSDEPLVHTAGGRFSSAGIESGDIVYVVSVTKGRLFLIGRMEVLKTATTKEAAEFLGNDDLWEADEHLLAREGSSTACNYLNAVDPEVVKELRFVSSGNAPIPLKFVDEERLDRQTLRGVRELTAASAGMLDTLLEEYEGDEMYEGDEAEEGDGDNSEDEDFEEEIELDALDEIGKTFSNPEHNREVERAAVEFVTRRLESEGWTVRSREQDGCGYDLHCSDGDREIHVEVKGTSGPDQRFILTEKEFELALDDDDFELHLVTGALTESPMLHVYTGEQLEDFFDFRALQWAFRLREVKSFTVSAE